MERGVGAVAEIVCRSFAPQGCDCYACAVAVDCAAGEAYVGVAAIGCGKEIHCQRGYGSRFKIDERRLTVNRSGPAVIHTVPVPAGAQLLRYALLALKAGCPFAAALIQVYSRVGAFSLRAAADAAG